jgi:transketolase
MQPESYRKDVLGKAPRIGIEAAIRQSWDLFLRRKDGFIGMTGFGASAPIEQLYDHFGITPAAVAAEAKRLIG